MDLETRYETQRIDHLGIVAGIWQEIGLIEEIDRQVGPGKQKVTVGQGLPAMELNALGFSSRPLYLMPDYLHNKPVDVLIGAGLVAPLDPVVPRKKDNPWKKFKFAHALYK